MSAANASRRPWFSSATLAVVAVAAAAAAAIALAYTKHEARRHFIELQRLSRERDALNIEWSRLQLEQSAYAAHALIESKAGDDLALKRPASEEIFLIGDDGDYRFVGLEPMLDDRTQAAAEEVGASP